MTPYSLIEFKIDTFQTKITDTKTGTIYYPPRKEYEKNKFEVSPISTGFFRDHFIDLKSLNEANLIGEIDAKISYYRVGGESHTMIIKKRTFLDIGDFGFTGGVDWYDC